MTKIIKALCFLLIATVSMAQQNDDQREQFNQIIQEHHRMMNSLINNFFNDDEDPFDGMDEFKNHFEKLLRQLPDGGGMTSLFKDQQLKISQREDGKFVYYEIDLAGMDEKSVKVDIRDDQLIITSQIQEMQTTQGSSAQSVSKSLFNSQQVVSLPEDIDSDKVESVTKNHKMILKFPKKENRQQRKKLQLSDGENI